MAFIQTIEPDEAEGELREIYDELTRSRGKIAEVHKIQSLNPPTISAHMELYKRVVFSRSPLSRAEREMIAVAVSAANGCAYCVAHHLEALKHFRPETQAEAIAACRYDDAELSERERALCEYARDLTLKPSEAPAAGEWAQKLRQLGMNDRALLDATLVVAYFNFVNRTVLGLGVELERDPGGYRYE